MDPERRQKLLENSVFGRHVLATEQANFNNPNHDERGRFAPGDDDSGPNLNLASVKEYGVHFETGKPVTFPFFRNTSSSRNQKIAHDDPYQQKIEPAGRYLSHNHDPDGPLPSGHEKGVVTFKKPLVLHLSNDEGKIYGENSWKKVLHKHYKKTGKQLSKAIAKDGYDGIVTINKYSTSEIVDLTMFHKSAK